MPDLPETSSRRGLISYSRTLARSIAILVIVTGGAIIAVSWVLTTRTVTHLTGDLFREISRQSVLSTRGRLSRAIPALDALEGLLAGELAGADAERLAKTFLIVLKANPEFTWVSYSRADGSFVGAYRTAEGEYRINRSHITQGNDDKTELFEHAVAADGAWTEIRHEKDGSYDPRTRPFYAQAVERGRRTWTRPYVFYEGVPGITCAAPHLGKGGALDGVLTIDFDLNNLSEFVAGVELSPHSEVFLFATDGTVLAHPSARVVTAPAPGKPGDLVTTRDINDAKVRAYFEKALQSRAQSESVEGDKSEQFEFTLDGVRYFASYNSFEVDLGLRWVVGAIAPASDFLGAVTYGGAWSVLISCLALGLSIGVATILARRISAPLTQLAGEMEQVGREFLVDDRPPASTGLTEIEVMNRALATMKQGLKSFASYVPRDVVRAMLATGQEAKLGGRTKELTIFFSDIEGFASVAETMSPGALVEMLSVYLDAMTKVIASRGGTVDKFLGDGILAFWNAPGDDAQHAALACEAAILCSRRLVEMQREAPTLRQLKTRIGLATGQALVGNIGTPERMNYTVMGDVPNLASRLERLNKLYATSVLVSEETYVRAKDAVVGRPLDVVAVKGKTRGVKVYELLCLASEKDAQARMIESIAEQALAMYLDRKFAKAADTFREILKILPGDIPTTMLLERVLAYGLAPPPETWTGVYVAADK